MEDQNKYNCLFGKCFISNLEASLNEHYIGKMYRYLGKLHLYTLFFKSMVLFLPLAKKLMIATSVVRVTFQPM